MIFIIVLELSDNEDPTKVRQTTSRRWDSLATVSLSAAMESEFQITVEASDVERMTSFEATKLLLEERRG